MTTTSVEPWVHLGEPVGFGDPPGFLPPGGLLRLQREETRLAAEEARKQAEAQERVDLRQSVAFQEAKQHALHHGLPFDPVRPFVHMPSVYSRSDALFAFFDGLQASDDRRALHAAGLDHLIPLVGQSPHPVCVRGLRTSGLEGSHGYPEAGGRGQGTGPAHRGPQHRHQPSRQGTPCSAPHPST